MAGTVYYSIIALAQGTQLGELIDNQSTENKTSILNKITRQDVDPIVADGDDIGVNSSQSN
jgi:hypothetical protein